MASGSRSPSRDPTQAFIVPLPLVSAPSLPPSHRQIGKGRPKPPSSWGSKLIAGRGTRLEPKVCRRASERAADPRLPLAPYHAIAPACRDRAQIGQECRYRWPPAHRVAPGAQSLDRRKCQIGQLDLQHKGAERGVSPGPVTHPTYRADQAELAPEP